MTYLAVVVFAFLAGWVLRGYWFPGGWWLSPKHTWRERDDKPRDPPEPRP